MTVSEYLLSVYCTLSVGQYIDLLTIKDSPICKYSSVLVLIKHKCFHILKNNQN